jgi:hypothetical protein
MDPLHPIRPTTEQPAPVAGIRPVPRAGAQRGDEQRREQRQRRQAADPAPQDDSGEHVDVRV